MSTRIAAAVGGVIVLTFGVVGIATSEAAQPPAKCKTISVVYETGLDLPIDATSRAVTTTRKCRGKIVVTVVRYDLETGRRL